MKRFTSRIRTICIKLKYIVYNDIFHKDSKVLGLRFVCDLQWLLLYHCKYSC